MPPFRGASEQNSTQNNLSKSPFLAEYINGNEVFVKKILNLEHKYSHIRRESLLRCKPTRGCLSDLDVLMLLMVLP